MDMNFDVIIRAGRVFDGGLGDARYCDVGISGAVIAGMGDLSLATARKTVDASGLTVCPGFIDAHSHSDVYLLLEPSAASKIYQGITTEVCGNCGASAAPLNGGYKMPVDWMCQLESMGCSAGGSSALVWNSVAEYRELYDEITPAINVALLIGHNTLHAGICGYDPRGASVGELSIMQKELERALDEGGIGLSSGLAYPPGSAVPREELIQLCKIVAREDGVYSTHMRSESGGLLESIDEALDIAEQSGARLQISHLKASGKGNWGKLEAAFGKIRCARSTMNVGGDRYPYTAGSTDLDILLPRWATYGGRDAILERIRNTKVRARLRDELLDHSSDYWDNVMVGYTQFEEFRGKYLSEIADALGMSEVDSFFHLIESDQLKTGGVFFSMSEGNLTKVLSEPYVSIGSDGSMRAPWGPLSSDFPHPRAYGSHTRFLRASLDGKVVGVGEAIHKMTALPARQLGLKNRGTLEVGAAADIIVFDPDRVKENATYAFPHALSGGMQHVFVNGVHSLEDGAHATSRAGMFLAND